MLDKAEAWAFAREWAEVWNAHELEAILAHYTEDVELTSPVVVERLGEKSGTVRGKRALRDYFGKGLTAYPELRFELRDVMWGVGSVVLYYVNQRGTMTGEFMEFAGDGRVRRVVATYSG